MATARPYPQTKIPLRTLLAMARDPAVDEHELRPYFQLDEARSRPFAPALRPNPATVDDEGLEGDFFSGTFSSLSRARRQWRYRQKLRGGFSGTRVVSEGDSWFQYPILLDDVIDQRFDDQDLAIFSLGAAGDTLAEMVQTDEISAAIRAERPGLLLLSGGGNDMVGGGRIATMLRPFDPALAAAGYPNAAFARFESELGELYRGLFARLAGEFPSLRILCHGYDYAIPGEGGDWLAAPMRSLGIRDRQLQRDIVRVLIDRIAGVLEALQEEFADRVFLVDCRGAVTSDRLWHDELHPKDAGFRAVAGRFRTVIDVVLGALETVTPRLAVSALPREAARGFMANPTPLAPATEGRIAARRMREMTGRVVVAPESPAEVAALNEALEKVHLAPDFLPARFLADGARRAAAVCRIITPLNTAGTGFLIARNDLVMTNNHVLPDANLARGTRCEFNFEQGGERLAVALEPDRLFITDVALDFTIVGCTTQGSAQIEPVPLLRDPATVALNDRVNIIQHPAGRPKEIAIHDNRVVELFEEVVRYRTDTEPGSSGSAVFNNRWELVALHHAGIAEGGGSARNEGIRIAKIVAHLLRRGSERGHESAAARAVIGTVEDTSPFLGFFDTAGVADDPREVEVPDTTGLPNFADIGFWNIEHFNDGVSADRVGRVADVLHRLNMDVMGLVEVADGAMRRLVSELRQRGGAFDFRVLDVGGAQDLAVLFDQDTTRAELVPDLLERHADELARSTPSGRLAFPRLPLFARCHVADVEAEAIEFMLIVVHFKAFGDVESRARRRLAAEILGRIIADIRAREQLPVVLGGDFNEVLSNDVLAGIIDTPDLFALTADDAAGSAASFIGSSRRSLIDHIVVSRDVRLGQIAGDDAAIVRLDRSVRDFADAVSDHVPLVFRIVGREQPQPIGDRAAGEPDNVILIPVGARRLVVEFG